MKRLLLSIALLLFAVGATAQVTTSAIKGQVTSSDKPLAGATIVARHNPSGSEHGTTTNAEGHYTLRGLRVGGPYTITISYIGYKSVSYTNQELPLAATVTYNASLTETSTAMDDVVIVASQPVNNDVFLRSTMNTIPTTERSIYDLTRLMPGAVSPKAGGLILGGQSTRYNAFTIDGTSSADIYGLGTTGMTGSLTQANPIPLDALCRHRP